KVENEIGVTNVMNAAREMGITSPLAPNASLALGTSEVTPLELTGAYAGFAAGGFKGDPYMVTENRPPSGEGLYRRPPGDAQPRVLSQQNALTMNAMLYDVVQNGTGHAALIPGRDVAGKTGTGGDFRDAWFVGFTGNLVASVWVGNDDFSPMKNVTG